MCYSLEFKAESTYLKSFLTTNYCVMRRNLFHFFLLNFCFFCFGFSSDTLYSQGITDTAFLFNHIRSACRNIHQGQYHWHQKYTRLQAEVDTVSTISEHRFYFSLNPADTLVGYQLSSINLDTTNMSYAYDGKRLAMHLPWIKTLEITDRGQYSWHIKELVQKPIFILLNYLLSDKKKDNKGITIITKCTFRRHSCYRLSIDNSVFYVSTLSFLPIGSTTKINSSVKGLVQYQIFEDWITDLHINQPIDEKLFKKSIFAGYAKERIFMGKTQEAALQLLPLASIAPDWKLPTLTGDSLSLHDLQGKIVIMDFWFKACLPCQLQMIALQQLQETIDTSKVAIISINIYDDPQKEKLTAMLSKAHISMKTVYHGEQIQKAYGISGAPSLFVIDRAGKIAYAKDGYSANIIKDLNKIIDQQLFQY